MTISNVLVAALLIACAHHVTGSWFDSYKKSNPEEYSGKLEGDIVLSEGDGFRNAMKNGRLWPNGVVPYEIKDMGAIMKSRVRTALEWLENSVGRDCIRFVPRTNERDYINVFSGSGCYSYVGMTTGKQGISLNRWGCFEHSTIQHEFLHALGFWHEQSRPDRDIYLKINWENISGANKHNFQTRYIDDLNTPYQYGSIMHYGKYAFSTNLRKTMEPRLVAKIGVRRVVKEGSWDAKRVRLLYGCDVPLKNCYNKSPTCGKPGKENIRGCFFDMHTLRNCRKMCGRCTPSDLGDKYWFGGE